MKGLKILLIGALVLTFAADSFAQTSKKKRKRVVKTPTTTVKTTPTTTTTTTPTTTVKTSSNTTLTDNEINGGLKEALFNGVRFAVDTLGKENGFLNDTRVKIPLPKSLQNVEKALRFAGQGKVVDEFVVSMNRAAEKAVPVAVDVFVDSIKQMTFNDVRNILFSGQDDSATQFFRRTSEETLRGKFRPIVEKFTGEVGVTQKYKDMMGKYGFVGKLLGQDATDLDGYVTQKALDGLFFMVAEQEKKIRKDPIGTGSTILQKVFGAIFK
jgi:hypothetical protein